MEAMLPKLHGFELCKKIAYDSAKKVPVIIVTGIYRESVYKSEAIRFYGASGFFEKPWKKEDLQPVVRSLLKEEKQAAAAAPPAEPPPAPRRAERKPEISDDWGLLIPGTAAQAKAEPPEGAADVEAEIDTILQSALADLGLKGSSHEEKPEPPKEREKPKPVKEAPVFTPPHVEEKPAAARREAEEKPAAPKPGTVPFGGFIEEPEKKKSKAGLFIGLVVVVAVAALVYLFVLKPKPPAGGPSDAVQQTETAPGETQTAAEPAPGAGDLAGASQQPSSSEPAPAASEPQQQPQAKTPESKQTAKPQASPAGANRTQTAAGRTSDPLAPIVPAQTPTLQDARPQAQEPAPAEKQAPAAAEAPVVRKAQEGDLLPLDQVDVQPVTIKSVPPLYPEMARRLGVEGTVSVNALISETGDVIQTQILRGIKGSYGFDRAAETSMRQWKFRPAMKDGARVKVWKPFNVVFRK
jgi:TonB family protein